jgi:transmembrane sensor
MEKRGWQVTNVHELPLPEQVYSKACLWLAKIDRGLSVIEEEELHSWLIAHPGHKEAFMRAAEMSDKMDSLSRLADMFPEPVRRSNKTFGFSLAITASFLVVFLAAVMGFFNDESTAQKAAVLAENLFGEKRFETGKGEQSSVTLADGSVLILNTNTLVKTKYSGQQRLLMLERGEVHINVAHDSRRPFSVYIGDKIVRAIGTAFNLEIKEDRQVELIVTEGKVLVGVRAAAPQTLSALARADLPELPSSQVVAEGEQLVLGDEQVEFLEAEEINVKLSWRGGNLVFRGESLETAIAEIGRYTTVEFIVQSEELKRLRIAGRFKAGDVEGLLAALQENFNVVIHRVSEEKVVLMSR